MSFYHEIEQSVNALAENDLHRDHEHSDTDPITGALLSQSTLLSAPFLIAGGLKIIYDLLLDRSFKTIGPPEERV